MNTIADTTYIELYHQARKLEREYTAAQQRAEGVNRILYQHSIDMVRADMAAYEAELLRRGYRMQAGSWVQS